MPCLMLPFGGESVLHFYQILSTKDEGLEGSWRAARITRVGRLRRTVEHLHLITEDSKVEKPLVETVSILKEGKNLTTAELKDRLVLRPKPPPRDRPLEWLPGTAVETLYKDAWWEGYVCHKGAQGDGLGVKDDHVLVYYRATNESDTIPASSENIRLAQMWNLETGNWQLQPRLPLNRRELRPLEDVTNAPNITSRRGKGEAIKKTQKGRAKARPVGGSTQSAKNLGNKAPRLTPLVVLSDSEDEELPIAQWHRRQLSFEEHPMKDEDLMVTFSEDSDVEVSTTTSNNNCVPDSEGEEEPPVRNADALCALFKEKVTINPMEDPFDDDTVSGNIYHSAPASPRLDDSKDFNEVQTPPRRALPVATEEVHMQEVDSATRSDVPLLQHPTVMKGKVAEGTTQVQTAPAKFTKPSEHKSQMPKSRTQRTQQEIYMERKVMLTTVQEHSDNEQLLRHPQIFQAKGLERNAQEALKRDAAADQGKGRCEREIAQLKQIAKTLKGKMERGSEEILERQRDRDGAMAENRALLEQPIVEGLSDDDSVSLDVFHSAPASPRFRDDSKDPDEVRIPRRRALPLIPPAEERKSPAAYEMSPYKPYSDDDDEPPVYDIQTGLRIEKEKKRPAWWTRSSPLRRQIERQEHVDPHSIFFCPDKFEVDLETVFPDSHRLKGRKRGLTGDWSKDKNTPLDQLVYAKGRA